MITADQVRVEVNALIDSHGHLNVAAACVRQLAGYAQQGMRAAAAAENEIVRDEPLPGGDEMRVSAELRSTMGKLYRAAGHQTFYTVVTVLTLEYALRGARAKEVDDLVDPGGHHTAAPPPCPSCREKLAAIARYRRVLAGARTDRPLGGSESKASQGGDDGE